MNELNSNGEREGFWEYYHPQRGGLWKKCHFINDNYNGIWQEYYRNGQIMTDGNYKNNIATGIWQYYYMDKKIKLKVFYL